jgi:AraC-like DNA-binding protein
VGAKDSRQGLQPVPEVEVRFAQPAEALRPFIPAYWDVVVEGEGVVEDLLRPEWTNIRLISKGDWAFGPSPSQLQPFTGRAIVHGVAHRAQWVRGSEGLAFCIPIFPMGWHRLIGAKASDFANHLSPLEAMFGSDGDRLYNAVMAVDSLEGRVAAADSFFLERLSRTKRGPLADHIEAVSLAVADPACGTVAELSERTGLSQSQLARLTHANFGFSPKMLIRRERFLRMLHSMQAMSVGEWPQFLDPQYTDQSHMIRDFKHFIGMAPTRYFAMERPLLIAVVKTLMRLMAEGKAEDLRMEEGRQTLAFRPDSG